MRVVDDRSVDRSIGRCPSSAASASFDNDHLHSSHTLRTVRRSSVAGLVGAVGAEAGGSEASERGREEGDRERGKFALDSDRSLIDIL